MIDYERILNVTAGNAIKKMRL